MNARNKRVSFEPDDHQMRESAVRDCSHRQTLPIPLIVRLRIKAVSNQIENSESFYMCAYQCTNERDRFGNLSRVLIGRHVQRHRTIVDAHVSILVRVEEPTDQFALR